MAGTGRVSKKKGFPLGWAYGFLGGVGILAGVALAFLPHTPQIPSPEFRSSTEVNLQSQEKPQEPAPEPLPQKKKYLYFVIDDGGNSLSQLQGFLDFPGKISIAVMPFLTLSKESAIKVRQAGKNLIIHMPMEAKEASNPPGTILLNDDDAAVTAKLQSALEWVPGALGMNNHQGSLATSDKGTMKVVLGFLKKAGLFFLDSYTSSDSVAAEAGRELDMTIWERDVFLDNERTREFILQAIEEGKKISDQKGRAIMIGHVWTSELAEVLTEIYPQLLEEGYTLEDLSHLFSVNTGDDDTGN